MFPRELFPTFMSLLEKFEIAYNIDGSNGINLPNGKSLVPSMLPNEEPKTEAFWETHPSKDVLQLDRHYQLAFVPAGILHSLE